MFIEDTHWAVTIVSVGGSNTDSLEIYSHQYYDIPVFSTTITKGFRNQKESAIFVPSSCVVLYSKVVETFNENV